MGPAIHAYVFLSNHVHFLAAAEVSALYYFSNLPLLGHGHLLLINGAFSDDGAFHPLETWEGDAVMKLFRERLLARLIEQHAISEELARKLLAWRHPGFSAHVGDPVRGQEGHRRRWIARL